MTDDGQEKHTDLSLTVRNSILEAILDNVKAERLDMGRVGGLIGAVNNLAATDLYSKGPGDNNYSKNSKLRAFDRSELIRPVETDTKLGGG